MENRINIFGGGRILSPSFPFNVDSLYQPSDVGIYDVENYTYQEGINANLPNNRVQYNNMNINSSRSNSRETERLVNLSNKYPKLLEWKNNDTPNSRNRYFSGILIVQGDTTKPGIVTQMYYRYEDGLLWFRMFNPDVDTFTEWIKLTTDKSVDFEYIESNGATGSLISIPDLREKIKSSYVTTGTIDPTVASATIERALSNIYTGKVNINDYITKQNPSFKGLDLRNTNPIKVDNNSKDRNLIKEATLKVNNTQFIHVNDNEIHVGNRNDSITLGSFNKYTKVVANDGEFLIKPADNSLEEIFVMTPFQNSDRSLEIRLPKAILDNNLVFNIKITEFGIHSNSSWIADGTDRNRSVSFATNGKYIIDQGGIQWSHLNKNVYSESIDVIGEGVYYLTYYNHKIFGTSTLNSTNISRYLDRTKINRQYYNDNGINEFYVAYSKGDIWLEVKGDKVLFKIYDGLSSTEKNELDSKIRNFTIEISNIIGGRL